MISIERTGLRFSFDRQAEPAAHAHSGDTVVFHCEDCYNGQLSEDGYAYSAMDMRWNNPITGPLYVEEAAPGDVLRVDIKRIALPDSGCACVRTGAGIYEIEGSHCRRFSIRDGEVMFDGGIRIPVRPMIGTIGTAPAAGTPKTQVPGEHGGNMDIREMGEGVSLYLPVSVPGALLSMGDLHAVQGDGETVICALEIRGEVTVQVTVLKDRADIPTPFLVTLDRYITTAADVSLDVCSVAAARKMHRFLQEHTGLNDMQSGLLLSLAGNLRISQVVNPLKGCYMEFPIGLAGERFVR